MDDHAERVWSKKLGNFQKIIKFFLNSFEFKNLSFEFQKKI